MSLLCFVSESYGVEDAAFQIIRGGVVPLDLATVQLGDGTSTYMSLLAGFGIVADIDIESEKFRKLGKTRFLLGWREEIVGEGWGGREGRGGKGGEEEGRGRGQAEGRRGGTCGEEEGRGRGQAEERRGGRGNRQRGGGERTGRGRRGEGENRRRGGREERERG